MFWKIRQLHYLKFIKRWHALYDSNDREQKSTGEVATTNKFLGEANPSVGVPRANTRLIGHRSPLVFIEVREAPASSSFCDARGFGFPSGNVSSVFFATFRQIQR
jgi:hypothetical protein